MNTEFDDEQMALLNRIPAVRMVSRRRIYYTDAFREEFRRRSKAGESAKAIFESAGLGPRVIGLKRIERCAARWLQEDDEDESGLGAGDSGIACGHGLGADARQSQPMPPYPPYRPRVTSKYSVEAVLLAYRERIDRLEKRVEELERIALARTAAG